MRAAGFATYPYKLAAFVIAAILAGMAGFLYALKDGYVNPEILAWHQSGAVLLMIILGGIGSLRGAVFGAIAFVAAAGAVSVAGNFRIVCQALAATAGSYDHRVRGADAARLDRTRRATAPAERCMTLLVAQKTSRGTLAACEQSTMCRLASSAAKFTR